MLGNTRHAAAVKPSVVDRITVGGDENPEFADAGYTWAQHLAAVRRDLADLLNTRQRYAPSELEGRRHVQQSLLTYGFPRAASMEWMTPEAQAHLAEELAATLRRFEPRLLGPRVTPVGLDGLGIVRFRIEGALRADPAPVRVAFDTYLDVERTEYHLDG